MPAWEHPVSAPTSTPSLSGVFHRKCGRASSLGLSSLGRTDRDPSEKPRATRKTGEAGASCGAGRARRATLEARRIDSDIEKSARSAEKARVFFARNRKVEASVASRRLNDRARFADRAPSETARIC